MFSVIVKDKGYFNTRVDMSLFSVMPLIVARYLVFRLPIPLNGTMSTEGMQSGPLFFYSFAYQSMTDTNWNHAASVFIMMYFWLSERLAQQTTTQMGCHHTVPFTVQNKHSFSPK